MTEVELLERLDAAVKASDADVELSAVTSRLAMLRFAGSRPTQVGDVEEVVVQARVAVGGRVGAARAGALDAQTLARLIDEAHALAARQPDTGFPGFDDGSEPTPVVPPSWDEATARAGGDAVAALVEPAFAEAAARQMTASGLATASSQATAVATRAGCRRAFRSTRARLDVIADRDGASGHAAQLGVALGALDAAQVAREAAEAAERARAPLALEPGEYDVILAPAAVAELLEWLALTSLGARSVEDGSSLLAGRDGTRVLGDLTLVDDALSGDAGCPTLPFDAEGTPKRRVVLIDGGLARGPVHDRATAARAGTTSTGHAAPLDDDLFEGGPAPQHLHLAPGTDRVDDLLGRVERGLYVTRFHYVNGLLDTRRALMTGMTRDGLFLVEQGRLGRGVRNLRWTESIAEAFGRVAGVTAARKVCSAGLSGSVYVCPTLLVRGWRFTGQSR